MLIRAGFLLLAHKLQEAADAGDIWHNDLQRWLSDACSEIKPEGQQYSYCYLMDFSGDSESGDVIYCCNGDTFQAPYEIQRAGEKISAKIDVDNAVNVLPVTSYVPEADDDDHMAAMESGKFYRKGELPLYERFISKAERKKASGASFAGKGRSFPILKASDVMAAVRSMGRAGSDNYDTATLKKNIIRIAKEKGFEAELPKAWREAQGVSRETSELRLCEAATTLETISLVEARADYEIKLIAPGLGSSAFYPKEVLQRDGPKVFKAGTHVYLNHPTAAEEAARPEGDVKNLAGVLTTDAVYNESHAKGPGLYGRMKVFADHGQMVEEKAAHVGMSIRAGGVAESGKTQGGKPILKELTSAESVDIVTRAGAGGMVLTESARTDNSTQEAAMDAAELTKLRESLDKGLATIALREARLDAREQAMTMLESLALPAQAKAEVLRRVMESVPMKEGVLDVEKFKESVTAEAKQIGALIAAVSGGGRVRGMGAGADVVDIDPVKAKEAKDRAKAEKLELHEAAESVFGELMGNPAAAKLAASKGEAA